MGKVANHPLGSDRSYSCMVRVKGESPAIGDYNGPEGA